MAVLEVRLGTHSGRIVLPDRWTGSVALRVHDGRLGDGGHKVVRDAAACPKCGGLVDPIVLTEGRPLIP